MESILPYFEGAEGEEVFGSKAIHHLWGMLRVQSAKGFGFNIPNLSSATPGFSDLVSHAHARALLDVANKADLNDPALATKTFAEMSQGQQIHFNQALAGLFGQQGAIDRLEEMTATPITKKEAIARIARTREVSGRRAAQAANHARGAAGNVAGGGAWKGMKDYYKRFASSELGQIMDTKVGRVATLGLGVMGAIGVLHAAKNRDRAPEDMGGPPHLPGGTPYTGPMGLGLAFQRMQEPDDDMWGTTYELRARGGMDASRFATQAQFIAGADSMSGSIGDSRSLENPDRQRQRVMESFR
jgi:hypothetical protein